MNNSQFESQSATVVDLLVQRDNMSRETAMKQWFNSKTYEEILRRKLTFISATRAYSELLMEKNNNEEWMKNAFDL